MSKTNADVIAEARAWPWNNARDASILMGDLAMRLEESDAHKEVFREEGLKSIAREIEQEQIIGEMLDEILGLVSAWDEVAKPSEPPYQDSATRFSHMNRLSNEAKAKYIG